MWDSRALIEPESWYVVSSTSKPMEERDCFSLTTALGLAKASEESKTKEESTANESFIVDQSRVGSVGCDT